VCRPPGTRSGAPSHDGTRRTERPVLAEAGGQGRWCELVAGGGEGEANPKPVTRGRARACESATRPLEQNEITNPSYLRVISLLARATRNCLLPTLKPASADSSSSENPRRVANARSTACVHAQVPCRVLSRCHACLTVLQVRSLPVGREIKGERVHARVYRRVTRDCSSQRAKPSREALVQREDPAGWGDACRRTLASPGPGSGYIATSVDTL
jgi:hypothetical protein